MENIVKTTFEKSLQSKSGYWKKTLSFPLDESSKISNRLTRSKLRTGIEISYKNALILLKNSLF